MTSAQSIRRGVENMAKLETIAVTVRFDGRDFRLIVRLQHRDIVLSVLDERTVDTWAPPRGWLNSQRWQAALPVLAEKAAELWVEYFGETEASPKPAQRDDGSLTNV